MRAKNRGAPAANKRIRRRKKIFLAAALVLILVVIGGEALYSYLRHPSRLLKSGNGLEGVDWEHEVAKNFDKDTINIALLGFDRTASRDRQYRIYRPDTIMIASLNFRTQKVAVVSIPRDSYIKIAGTDVYDKINASYMYGYDLLAGGEDRHQSGINTVLRTIQDFLGGVPLHYYLSVDMDAVVEMVDKLEGIEFEVDVQVREPGSNHLLVDRGLQNLSGQDFLSYVRFRGVGGDYGRIDRQQKILLEAFRQLREKGRLTDIPQLIHTLTERLETNLSPAQVASLALFGKEMDPAGVSLYAFPGSSQYAPQGDLDIFYLVINEKARVELIKAIFEVAVAEKAQIVLPGKRASNNQPGTAGPVLPGDPPSDVDLLPGG